MLYNNVRLFSRGFMDPGDNYSVVMRKLTKLRKLKYRKPNIEIHP